MKLLYSWRQKKSCVVSYQKYIHNRGDQEMKKTSSPMFLAPSIVSSQKTTFYKLDEKVVIEAPGKLIRQLIKMCDGTRELHDIIGLLHDEWDENSVLNLIKGLFQLRVLTDGRHFSETVWKITENLFEMSSFIKKIEV